MTLPVNTCPFCGYVMDSATGVGEHDGSAPIDGDLSLCLNCGEILQYDSKLTLSPLLQSAFIRLPKETQHTLQKARRLIIERGVIR